MTDDIYDMARVSCEEIYETPEALMSEQERREAQLDWEAANAKGWTDPDAPAINDPGTNTNGTHLQGYVTATREQLEARLGPIKAEYGDKVCGLWTIKHGPPGGTTVATIYDWKEDRIPSGKYSWHIGGRSKDALDLVERLTGMATYKF